MHPRFARLAFCFATSLLCAASASAQSRAITTALEIRALSPAEAEQGIPVDLRGIVVFIEGPSAVFLQDESSTTFFRTDRLPPLKPGDEIEVRGKTRMGLYFPGIATTSRGIRVAGHRSLPAGIPAQYDDLVFGRYHYQRVTVEGIVRSVQPTVSGGSRLRLAMGSRMIDVYVEAPPGDRALADHRVRLTGLAAGLINAPSRQLVRPHLRATDWSELDVLARALPVGEAPAVSAEDLLAFRVSGLGERRVRIDGVVAAAFRGGQVFLRQGERAFAVLFVSPVALVPGDRITVAGFPSMEQFSASVVDAELLAREPGPAPAPVDLAVIDELHRGPGSQLKGNYDDRLGGTYDDQLRGKYDGHLVRVTAAVSNAFKGEHGATLLVQGRVHPVQVRVPEGVAVPPAGSLVRLTGIGQVETAKLGSGFRGDPDLVSLRIATPSGLEVLRTPSWWTPQRLVAGLAALAGIVLIAALWIALLRRQVRRQTAVLRHRIEAEAALEERQRIAREFHDTLEQELAGVSLRLDALATREIDEKGRNLVGDSRALVSRIQSETRDLIRDLRDSNEIAGDLAAALRSVAARLAEENSVTIAFDAATIISSLPAATVHDLRMIAREAITNAIKHGAARQISVALDQVPGQLRMRVTDDGTGFNPGAVTQDRRGHFGCAGIRERARKRHANVTWSKVSPHGTAVEVILPLAAAVSMPVQLFLD